MTQSLYGFCRELLDVESVRQTLDPERLAARFVRFFALPARPTLDELADLMRRARFGEVSGRRLDSLKGIHFSVPGGGYDIYYRQDMWDGAREHTVLHESLRDYSRDTVRSSFRLAAGAKGVPCCRPLRGGGPDATGGVFTRGRQVGSGCARIAADIPLLLRLSDVAADRGGEGSSTDGCPVRAQGERRSHWLDRTPGVTGDGGAAFTGFRDTGLAPHLRAREVEFHDGADHPHPALWRSG